MDMTEEYSGRIRCFEAGRKLAEQNYDRNPQDADNLTTWAVFLLELSQFQDITDSKKSIIEAISKLEEALVVSPKMPDALMFLGNAHTSFAFLTPEIDVARDSFDKASLFYKQAVQEEPTNEGYLKYLQMNIEARELHMEIYKEGGLMGGGGGSSVSSNSKTFCFSNQNSYQSKAMDVDKGDILDRLLLLERKRKFAEAHYVLNPRDADNLTRWAGALFEMSQAQNKTNAREMRKDAISKLDKALSLNSENHYILWCLGNVYCSLAKSYPVGDTSSTMYFDRAYGYFKKALDKDPENKTYLMSKQKFEQKHKHYFKEMSDNNNKAPEPHMEETHKNGLGLVGESSGSSNPKAAKKPKKTSNLRISEAMDAKKGEILDRLLFFERERKYAEALYVLNPLDADNLTRWAGALFELSRAQNNTNAREMRKDAISKLDNALSINSENHYILWCLGNTYCSLAKTYPVRDTKRMYFDRAYGYFKKALDKDPENKLYLTSKQEFLQNFGHYFKEMSDNNNKAPEPHMETHKNGLGLVGDGNMVESSLPTRSISKPAQSPPPPHFPSLKDHLSTSLFGYLELLVLLYFIYLFLNW